MARFGIVPPEPARVTSTDAEPRRFRLAADAWADAMRRRGFPVEIEETLRTDARQRWLYGFGRLYDDGRGIVTNAPDGSHTWHRYAVARDYACALAATHPDEYRRAAIFAAEACGLTSGYDWHHDGGATTHFVDGPHIQFGKCAVSPTWRSALLYTAGGLPAVHKAIGAL